MPDKAAETTGSVAEEAHGATAQGVPAADEVLDARGLNCPLPILRTKLALARMQPGQVLHVMATDPHSVIDFKAFCARTDHDLLEVREGEGIYEFRIRRGHQRT